MELWEAIRGRRTIAKFDNRPIPADQLNRLLEAGIWAPNHHLTEPWTFVVVGPVAQRQLAEKAGALKMAKLPPGEAPERLAQMREDAVRKFLAKPTLVAVAVRQDGDALRRQEDYAAACCAIQNIQLAAWAEGVGTQWGTGAVTRERSTLELLGLDPDNEVIVGFVYFGYPAETPERPRKRGAAEVIRSVP
jgi:nitroreductase